LKPIFRFGFGGVSIRLFKLAIIGIGHHNSKKNPNGKNKIKILVITTKAK